MLQRSHRHLVNAPYQVPTYGCNVNNCATGTVGFAAGVVTEEVVKPSRSRVEFHELDADLMANVRVAPLKRVATYVEKHESWPVVFYTTPSEDHWKEPNYFILILESQVLKEGNEPVKDEVWMPFSSQDIESWELLSTDQPQSGKKYQRVISRFGVRLAEKAEGRARVPYLQFICEPKTIKHHNSVYKRGDLITVVVKHPEYPLHWPTPPLLTVKPEIPTTFVPMLSKQRLCLVTETEKQTVEFKSVHSSTVKLVGTMQADYGKQCNIFNCSKPTTSSEVITIRRKSKKNKTVLRVVIPMVEKDPRCPVLLNPVTDSVIHGGNIDGFVVRLWKNEYHPIVIMDQTPIRCVHTAETGQYFERRFEVDKRRPFFYLTKKESAWVLS